MTSLNTYKPLEIKKIPFSYQGRDIYHQSGTISDYPLFFANSAIADTFPIVLLGNWKTEDITPEMMQVLAFQHVSNPRSVVFIIKNEADNSFGEDKQDTFDIEVFERKNERDMPLVHMAPIHSSHTLSWNALPKSARIHLELQKLLHATQTNITKQLHS